MNVSELYSGALYDKFEFLTLLVRGLPMFGGQGTKTQGITTKFGMLVISLEENAVSIDEHAHRKYFWGNSPQPVTFGCHLVNVWSKLVN